MSRKVLGLCAAVVLLTACTSSESLETVTFSQDCGSGLQLCADEGLIQVRILRKTCVQDDECRTERLGGNPFLEFIQLDGPVGERCGPGDCGAVPDALQQGWAPGRWKIVAPSRRGLTKPDPVTIDLDAGEVLNVDLVYLDESVG